MENTVKKIIGRWWAVVAEINNKYQKPRIKMTPFIKFSLFGLRVYLLLLIAIMIFKFITMMK